MNDIVDNSSDSVLQKTAINMLRDKQDLKLISSSHWLFRRRATQTQKYYLNPVYLQYTSRRPIETSLF